MVDYQEMYYKMNRAMEKAINTLVEAQRECEEDYLKQTDPPDNGKDGEEEKRRHSRHDRRERFYKAEGRAALRV